MVITFFVDNTEWGRRIA